MPRPAARSLRMLALAASAAFLLAFAAYAPATAEAAAAAADEPPPTADDSNAACASSTYTVPQGVTYARITVVGQHGTGGQLVQLAHGQQVQPGAGGDAGIVEAVVEVRAGQVLWLAPASALMAVANSDSQGFSAGGRGSFVSNLDPAPYCPGGAHPASEFPTNGFLAVAGGGGGGGGAGDYDQGAHGGDGGAPGHPGHDGGNNDSQDGAGGGAATTTSGGSGGAAGHRVLGEHGKPGTSGGYLTGGAGGQSKLDGTWTFGGDGGSGFFGGGGGGGGQNGGSGGGGGGSNYLPPYVPTTAPTPTQPTGTLQNGTTTQGPDVHIAPIYPTTTTITVDPTPSFPADQLTATVQVQSTGGVPATGGTVTLQVPGRAALTATVAGGRASFPLGVLPVGGTALTAHYAGIDTTDAVFQPSDASATHTVTPYEQGTTVTLVTSGLNPALERDTVTFGARVVDQLGRKPEGGTVTFTARDALQPDTAIPLGTATVGSGAAAGTASVDYSFFQPALYRVTAQFSGFTSRTVVFAASTSEVLQQTVQAITMPTIVRQPVSATITYGDQPPLFEAAAVSNPDPTPRWQIKPPGSTDDFVDIPDATSVGYRPPADTPTGTRFRALFSNGHGTTQTDVAVLTVNKARLAVIADDVTMEYGTDAPPLTTHFGTGDEGFRLSDGPQSLQGAVECASTPAAGPSLAPGRYPITCRGLASSNYDLVYRAGTLLVREAAQIITFTEDESTLVHVGDVFDVPAVGGRSGQPVVFSTDAASALWCTVTLEGQVSIASGLDTPFAGTCIVYADQAGSGLYPPAQQVSVSIPVEKFAPRFESRGGSFGVTFGQSLRLRAPLVDEGQPNARYQWYMSPDNRSWVPIPRGQSAEFVVFPHVTPGGTFYKLLAYNSTGETPSEGRVFSEVVHVRVDPAQVLVQAPDVTIAAGSAPPALTPELSPFVGLDTAESLGIHVECGVPEEALLDMVGRWDNAVLCSGFSHPDYSAYYIPGTLTVTEPTSAEGPGGGGSGSGSGGAPPAGGAAPSGGADAGATTPSSRSALAATGAPAPLGALALAALTLAAGTLTFAVRRRSARSSERCSRERGCS